MSKAQNTELTDEALLNAFWSEAEVRRTGAIDGLMQALRRVVELAQASAPPKKAAVSEVLAWAVLDQNRNVWAVRRFLPTKMSIAADHSVVPLGEITVGVEEHLDPSTAAIKFALTLDSFDTRTFLMLWSDGEFDRCRSAFPEAPAECYIGADPLFGRSHEA
ncbi:hypothetical protein [Chromobacterium phragmitis]|uniref:Uncharacterized protein n=1 Tax=Chromobacterium phragmitis TaxID=2202141 RepID=A0ABV0J0Q5_9NEIS